MDDSVEILDYIDTLANEDECAYVTIFAGNADFTGPNNAIDVYGEWTNHIARRFYGESVLDCLKQAHQNRNKVELPK